MVQWRIRINFQLSIDHTDTNTKFDGTKGFENAPEELVKMKLNSPKQWQRKWKKHDLTNSAVAKEKIPFFFFFFDSWFIWMGARRKLWLKMSHCHTFSIVDLWRFSYKRHTNRNNFFFQFPCKRFQVSRHALNSIFLLLNRRFFTFLWNAEKWIGSCVQLVT